MQKHVTDRMRRIVSTVAAGVVTVVAVVAIGVGDSAAHDRDDRRGNHPPRDEDARLTGPQRAVVRQATKQFRDIDVALAAGYLPTDDCVELHGVGGMGYHYVKPSLIDTPGIDPTLPEVLVYAPSEKGGLTLVALEWLAIDGDQDLSTDGDRPTLFGQAFDGPMPGHEPGMPVHYDLHAWVHLDNPTGELQPWNPRVTCPRE